MLLRPRLDDRDVAPESGHPRPADIQPVSIRGSFPSLAALRSLWAARPLFDGYRDSNCDQACGSTVRPRKASRTDRSWSILTCVRRTHRFRFTALDQRSREEETLST